MALPFKSSGRPSGEGAEFRNNLAVDFTLLAKTTEAVARACGPKELIRDKRTLTWTSDESVTFEKIGWQGLALRGFFSSMCGKHLISAHADDALQ